MDCSSLDVGTFQLIGQVCFAARDEFDLCLSEFHEYGEIDVAFVKNQQAPGLQKRQNIRPETLIVCFWVTFVPNLLW